MTEAFDKLPIEVGEFKKHLDVTNRFRLWLDLDRLDSIVLHLYSLCKDNISKKSNLILVKPALFQVGKKPVFSELVKDPAYGLYMWLACLLGIDQDVVQIYDDKDIKFFSEDFIDIALKAGWCVGKSERYDLVLEMAVPNAKGSLPLITFSDSHPVIGTGQVQLDKILGLTQSI